jgi:hypothetical protein
MNFKINAASTSMSARLREILIDDHFNNILVSLIALGIPGKHIGIFLSQTGLSIKETQTFSPDGYSLRRLQDMEVDAAFILKFIIVGFKVTDLGNIVRIADDSIIQSMISLPEVTTK